MRARLEDVHWPPEESFLVRSYDLPRFAVPWHFHPEIELTLILEGHGDRCVGDHLGSFAAGDLVLLGAHLPHYWRSDSPGRRRERARAIVIHLREDSFGAGFLELPESRVWKHLLAASRSGLAFQGAVRQKVAGKMQALPSLSGTHRLLALLDLLQDLAEALPQADSLAGALYRPGDDSRTADRMRRVYNFLYAHLEDPLSLPQVARVAGMSDAAFSRYCKKTTGRTLTRLINELRVARACQHLIETSKSVSEIAFLSGFQSLSNFNRAFAENKGEPPLAYRSRQTQALLKHK